MPTPHTTPPQEPLAGLGHPEERAAVQYRRSVLYADGKGPEELWGLALSGGGIRSATFCLGVLQALSQPGADPIGTDGTSANSLAPAYRLNGGWPLLARFDFLSTVSGGGYVGGFYSAMFRSRKSEAQAPLDTPQQRARAAYQALATDPPGRLNTSSDADLNVADRPLRWLRENGRYLAPGSSGDLVYDAAIYLRNLCAIHYVAGITLLLVFMLMFALRYASLLIPSVGFHAIAQGLEQLAQPTHAGPNSVWFSPLLGLLGIWVALALIPCSVAYWLDQDAPTPRAQQTRRGPVAPRPALAALLLWAAGMYLAFFLGDWNDGLSGQRLDVQLLVLFDAVLFMALGVFAFAKYAPYNSARLFRSRITRWLSFALLVTLTLALLTLIETGGQTLYLWMRASPPEPLNLAGLMATLGAIAAAVRRFAPLLAQPGKGGLLSKLPLSSMLGMVGLLAALCVAVLWQCLATALVFGFQMPVLAPDGTLVGWAFTGAHLSATWAKTWLATWGLMVFTGVGFVAAGYFMGFVNLSSLQTMYAARLTRAYLGASNPARFSAQHPEKMRVTEPDEHDDFTRAEFYDPNKLHLGPAHLINVTINATRGSADQLTQRDRQGIPLAVTPAGVVVNGARLHNPAKAAELSIGQWIGLSGAAFSTGIGRGTRLGMSMLFCLLNIRLGWWWKSGQADRTALHLAPPNQRFLWREFQADFNGTDGSHWYLSDGGHFENTGVYELLRRRVGFIVSCDCGADPHYTFEDLANLMRLARIDFSAEFEPITPADCEVLKPNAKALMPYFARTASDFSAPDATAGRDPLCALLYRVRYAGETQTSTVLVLKPRLIADAALDLCEYRTKNTEFPQQTTFDQFFDEAQWESYRKLGATIASRIFPVTGARPH
jgi:hypothetical protein